MLPNSVLKVFRRFRFNTLTLRERLVIFIVMIAVPIVLFVIYNGDQRIKREISQIETYTLNLAQVAASSHTQHMESARQLLLALAQLPAIQSLDNADCDVYLSQLLSAYPNYTMINAVDLTGQAFCSTVANTTLDFSQTAWFEEVMATGNFTVGEFQVTQGTGATSVTYAYPIYNQTDSVIGAVMVNQHLDWLIHWLEEIRLPLDTHMTLIDQQGTILAHIPSVAGSVGTIIADTDMLTALANSPDGTVQAHGEHTETWIYGFTRLNYGNSDIYVVVGMPKAEALADIQSILTRNLVMVGLMILLISVGALIGGSRFIIQPIEELNYKITKLEEGELGQSTTMTYVPHSVDELKQLDRSIRKLSVGLAEKQDQLDHIMEKMRAEIKKRKQAQSADKLKLRFLGMIAHELQTPLTSIKGFATTLLAEDVTWDEANQRRFLQLINEETDTVKELIVQLLDLSQIETGNMRIQPIATCISTIAQDASPHLTALAEKHDLTLDVMNQVLKPIFADPKRVTQVLVNLVSNAVKYSDEGTKIIVDAHQAHNHIQVNVRDEGYGIPEDQLERVFMPYIRSEKWLENHEGTGLGLAICKGIVNAHGGRIWATINPNNIGVTVSFTLPLEQQAIQYPPQLDPIDEVDDEDSESYEYDSATV